MKRGGRLVRRIPLRRTSAKRAPNDITPETRKALRERSRGVCEVCAVAAAVHAHHRKLRRYGDHRLVNLLDLCFDCHATIHANVARSLALGLLVPGWADPADVPAFTRGAA